MVRPGNVHWSIDAGLQNVPRKCAFTRSASSARPRSQSCPLRVAENSVRIRALPNSGSKPSPLSPVESVHAHSFPQLTRSALALVLVGIPLTRWQDDYWAEGRALSLKKRSSCESPWISGPRSLAASAGLYLALEPTSVGKKSLHTGIVSSEDDSTPSPGVIEGKVTSPIQIFKTGNRLKKF